MSSAHHFNTTLTNLPNFQAPFSVQHELSSCVSNNTASDEGDDQLHNNMIIDERKRRRMISNRESARRSRMRKQKYLDELWSQVVRLRNENYILLDKLNHLLESHDEGVEENAKLKEEVSGLRQMVADAQLSTTYNCLKDLEKAHLNTESTPDQYSQ
ncbi:Basic leucine zipper 43 [Heracleum sosnowskyi]|uniref:Basic leucine zipper 43 n=1 Tax=Heracleum sosnowskyi TaxID=360622 RepID=A0AAD8IS18_9APIA|nr:Basic leucine zipper 43 [Heracleum sosnowskyi]